LQAIKHLCDQGRVRREARPGLCDGSYEPRWWAALRRAVLRPIWRVAL